MSSKTFDFIFKLIGNPLARTGNSREIPRYKLNKASVEQLPIYLATPEEQRPFIEECNIMLKLSKSLHNEVNGFQNWLKTTFNIEKLPQKLEKYYKLSLDEFLDELRKKKVDVRSRENQELLRNEYQKSLNIITPLRQEIEQTDNEIDQMVYDLYSLTEDEIKIIEENLRS